MRGRPREFNREHVLEEAMQVFRRRGFNGTGLAELEEATGLGRQSIYNAFGDKERLFDAAVERYVDTKMQPLAELLQREGSAMANVREVLDLWEANLAGGDGCGCLIANSICEVEAVPTDRGEMFQRVIGRIEAAFRQAFETAQAQGELSADRDVKAMARLFATLGQGLSVVSRVENPEFIRGAIHGAREMLAA